MNRRDDDARAAPVSDERPARFCDDAWPAPFFDRDPRRVARTRPDHRYARRHLSRGLEAAAVGPLYDLGQLLWRHPPRQPLVAAGDDANAMIENTFMGHVGVSIVYLSSLRDAKAVRTEFYRMQYVHSQDF